MPQKLFSVLEYALQAGAADVLICEGKVPCIRLNGNVGKIDGAPETPVGILDAVLGILPHVEGVQIAGPFAGSMWRVRYSRSASGKVALFRPLLSQCPDLDSLSVPTALKNLLSLHSGLVLFCGPTASGKTVTATAFVSAFCKTALRRAVFLDPIQEYEADVGESLVIRTSLGNCPEQLVSRVVRAGADILWFGDLEKLALPAAIQAAEDGALAVATVTANSSASLLASLLDSESDLTRALFASNWRAIVFERLIARADGAGMVPAWEVVYNNQNISSQIRNGEFFKIQQSTLAGISEGMLPFDESLGELCRSGMISKEDALKYAYDSSRLSS